MACMCLWFQSSSQQTCLAKAIWQMKVAIVLEVPTEAKLCLNPPITQTANQYVTTQVLHSQGRPVDAMLPDGNCLFRPLSKALFAVQSGHIKLWKLLYFIHWVQQQHSWRTLQWHSSVTLFKHEKSNYIWHPSWSCISNYIRVWQTKWRKRLAMDVVQTIQQGEAQLQ